jgi:choline-sulfatase
MLPPVSETPARRVFYACLAAACVLGAVDATLAGAAAHEGLEPSGRVLAAAYALSPWIMVSAFVGAMGTALVHLWTSTRRQRSAYVEDTAEPTADAPALLLAVVVVAATFFVTARLIATQTHNRALGAAALAIALPAAALGGTYLWSALRRALGALDEQRDGPGWLRPSRLVGASVTAFIISLGGATLANNEALNEVVGVWPPAFVVAWCVTAAAAVHALSVDRFRAILRSPSLMRCGVALSLLGTIGVLDVLSSMDARPGVKSALLDHTLIFKVAARMGQNLFDADRDGYASALGGGDCDDDNAAVYPGAPEVPLNGVDDDCFGGDALEGAAQTRAETADDAARLSEFPRPSVVHRPNILHITIDTLGASRIGAWGYARDTTPQLDALAARGLRFSWAFSQGAQTKVSMPSMFVGRYFSEVDRSPDSWATVWPENTTLAERLRDAGYTTVGQPAHRFFLPAYGLHQGFQTWDLTLVEQFGRDIVNVTTSHLVADRAIAWLKQRRSDDGPFYFWVHFFDPHHFYQSHDTPTDLGDQDSDRYDEEVRYTDEHLGRLLEALASSEHGPSTYVVLHGDHGEGFGEHGYRYHGQHLFNDQVHVPLVLVGPGLPQRVVEPPVALLDVTPTLLDLAGIPIPRELSGISLIPFGSPRLGAKHPPVFTEMMRDSNHSDRRALIEWPWKFQWGITFDERTLYNLQDDPQEQNDLIETHPAEAERLNAKLRAWMASEVRSIQPRR